MSYDELYHHGILGMKWGVRRFQNEDGSYTKKGLERYRKSEEAYNKTKSDYESGKATRSDLRASKKKLSEDYDHLKRDYLADKGRKLYQKGQTIGGNKLKAGIGSTIVGVAASNAYLALKDHAMKYTWNYREFKLTEMTAAAALGAAALTEAGILLKTHSKNKKLRAYYAHSSPKDD